MTVNLQQLIQQRYGNTDTAAKRKMAREFKVTLSTVNRWLAGTVAVPFSVVLALKLMEGR